MIYYKSTGSLPQRKLGLNPERGSTPVCSTCLLVACYPCRDQLRGEEDSHYNKSRDIAMPTIQGKNQHFTRKKVRKAFLAHKIAEIEIVVGWLTFSWNWSYVTTLLIEYNVVKPSNITVFQGKHFQPLPLWKIHITRMLTTTPTYSKMLKCFPWKFWSLTTLLEKEPMERWLLSLP